MAQYRPREHRARYDCRWPGCRGGAAHEGFVCNTHWRQVPQALRTKLTWAASDVVQGKDDAAAGYRRAREKLDDFLRRHKR